ncbi:MAG: hypothetical protein ACR2KD_01060 [Thermoleophilaceae bacterium]
MTEDIRNQDSEKHEVVVERREVVIEKHELSPEELEAQGAEALPDREAMSLVDANVAAPVNAAVAANILSEGSTAEANAEQDVDIDQSNN